jgi:L-ribulose-5-phosphate 3-epimerase UlaE
VVASKSKIYDNRTPADFVANDQLDALAKSIGFTAVEYRVDLKNSPAPKEKGSN